MKKAKKWAKAAGTVAAGSAAATGAYMLGERGIQKLFSKRWNKTSSNWKVAILAPLAGAAGFITARSAHRLAEEKRRAES